MKKKYFFFHSKNFLIFFKIKVLLLFLPFVISCEMILSTIKKESKLTYVKTLIKTHPDNIKVPFFFMKIIKKKYIEHIRKTQPKNQSSDAELTARIPRSFFKMKVILKEKTKGVLKNHYLISLPETGGVIDLSHYLSGSPGSFFVQFKIDQNLNQETKEEIMKNLKIFYSSHTKKTRFGGHSVGTNCGTFLDITSYVLNSMKKNGMMVFTKGKQNTDHIEFLGGTFYFTYFKKKYLFIGIVRFKDSRFSSLECKTSHQEAEGRVKKKLEPSPS